MWKAILNSKNTKYTTVCMPVGYNNDNFDNNDLNLPITEQEIRQSIKSMKNNRSPGPDGIFIEM